MRFMGIDPSLTSTGVCYPDGETTTWSPKPTTKGVERLSWFSSQLNGVLVDPTTAPNLILLEGYAYGRANQAHQLGELGGVLRLTAHRAHKFVVVVPPSTLKKYATGKGNASKEEVLVQAVLRAGREFTNDEADAWWLHQIGMAHYINVGAYKNLPGFIDVPMARHEAIADLDFPERDDAEVLGPVAAKALRGDEYTDRASDTGSAK